MPSLVEIRWILLLNDSLSIIQLAVILRDVAEISVKQASKSAWRPSAASVIPVNVEGVADKQIISYEFDLRYDPAVIQPLGNAVDLAGTVSRGLMVVTNPYEPGLLRAVIYGPMPIDENGVLLNLRFTAAGAGSLISPLRFERIMFNEGEQHTTVIDGGVELLAATH